MVEFLMEKPIEIWNLQSEHKIMKSKELRIILESVELQFGSLKASNTVKIGKLKKKTKSMKNTWKSQK